MNESGQPRVDPRGPLSWLPGRLSRLVRRLRPASATRAAFPKAERIPLAAFVGNTFAERAVEFYLLWAVASGQQSSLAVSMVFVARFGTPIVVGPLIYRAVRRWQPSSLMMLSQIAKVFPLSLLLLVNATSSWAILVLVPLAAAASLASFTFDVAFQTTIPDFTKTARLETVNSAVQLLRQVSNAFAPVVGGAVIAGAGGQVLVAIGIGLSFAALAATIAASRSGHRDEPQQQLNDGASDPGGTASVLIGAHSTVAFVVMTVVAVNIAIAGTYTLMPRYIQVMVGAGPAIFGSVAAAAAIGAILGAGAFGSGVARAHTGATVTGGIGLTVVATLLLAAVPGTVTAAAGYLLLGLGSVIASLAVNVLLQRRLRGPSLSSAMVSKSLAVRIAALAASLAAGFAADKIGLGATLLLVALAVAAAGTVATVLGRGPLSVAPTPSN